MGTLLQLQNVSKVIKGKKIIDGLSFDVKSGEIFGFLGPNGAGKTTTIRMIVGHMNISDGDILINGVNVKDNFAKAAQYIGAIIENPEMYKFMTGYQNLMQYARMTKGVTKSKIDEIIELVGLKNRIHDKVKTYSLGMRQRLGLAQALLHDPKLLILDEPTNGLDPAGIREIRHYLRKLTTEKDMAVIVSSHLLAEMELMCDRFAIIQNGKLRDIQNVHESVDNKEYKDRYFFHANDVDALFRHTSDFGDWQIEKVENGIEINLKKDEVPDLIKHLTDNGIRLFEVKIITKSLEDRFLEITGNKEETQLA
ncbi:ABC transporter ATP-binding protein [Bacillus sp. WMMC1349]|uniref:ABC transporter ATP-binding protein n=1 Tax=Bacillus sp. WMMC1349 TaxID=2736254 RepID=UPI0015519FFD|nr:ABC transporter ATP-binding protein [Bacillus sp. WMMC1349]NPC91978.1 ABC transporter ATP-binding protein [Bacillus sp. WMMC1349]